MDGSGRSPENIGFRKVPSPRSAILWFSNPAPHPAIEGVGRLLASGRARPVGFVLQAPAAMDVPRSNRLWRRVKRSFMFVILKKWPLRSLAGAIQNMRLGRSAMSEKVVWTGDTCRTASPIQLHAPRKCTVHRPGSSVRCGDRGSAG